ncbi:M10 family metallopeptidase C-terminal domain-containing protein [Pseudomonas costantinii]|uniref:M10 family metallopeptidase C-terminal domain-containing protein n=1 Tax=Pseudomonas costantinii TaxID=168469 RepID=UPI0034E94A3E
MRPAQQQYNQQNRRWDAPATGNRTANSGYYDATQRSDDPHISKINKQSFDKQRAVEQLTQGTSKWQDWNRNGKTEISYHFKNDRDGSFNETQKQEARRSIQSWSDVANLAFTENGRLAEGRLSFRISNNETAAQGFYPSPNADGGDTVYNPSFVARPVITHEIGHTLGLTHPGHYNGQASEEQRVYAQDSKAHTLMSYFEAQGSGKLLGERPKAPMMDDISAIQKMYGANHQTRRENNTYGFNANSGRDYYSLKNHLDTAAFCIWDGAGNDTLDVSGYGNNQVINLRAGSFSDVGGLQGNVSIARNCLIENAIGGSGHDALIGNDADNRLTGGGGADRLRGGRGADTFVYNRASDSAPAAPDEIMDFTSGIDKIDLRAIEKEANTHLTLVTEFTGRAGETIVSYNPQTYRYFVAIDLTGNRNPDFLVNSTQVIKPKDIFVN